jgi:hypothetical protein
MAQIAVVWNLAKTTAPIIGTSPSDPQEAIGAFAKSILLAFLADRRYNTVALKIEWEEQRDALVYFSSVSACGSR